MNRPVPRTLRQLIVGFITGFGLLSLVLAGGIYLAARYKIAQDLDTRMEYRMRLAQHAFSVGGTANLLKLIDTYASNGGHFGYMVISPSGRRIRGVEGVPLMAPGWGAKTFRDLDDGTIDPARTLTSRMSDGTIFTIVADRDFVEHFDFVIVTFLALSLAALAGIALAGGLSLEAAVRRRLFGVNETAQAIMNGELDHRVPITGTRDEFDALAQTLNHMLDRINGLISDVRLMTSYIAHDLRRPLAKLAQDLRDQSEGCITAAGCSTVIRNAAERCNNLIDLFGSILELGEIDPDRVKRSGSSIDLTDLVTTLCEAHLPIAEAGGRTLQCKADSRVSVFAVPDLIAQAIINLLENALSHTQPGANIVISISNTDQFVIISVVDHSLVPNNLDTASFFAADRTSRHDPDRPALGLKLVRTIAEAHGGSLVLSSSGTGLSAKLSLML